LSKPSATNTRERGQVRRMIERPDDDDYPTPPAATRALLALEYFGPRVYDPFAGAGVLLAAVREHGYKAFGTTLNDYHDPFTLGITAGVDARTLRETPAPDVDIVSNPPYGLVKENDGALINSVLEMAGNKTALLMDASFTESIGRYDNVFSQRAPARIYHFIDRVTMIPNRLLEGRADPDFPHGGATAFAWFVWERPYHPPPTQTFWIKAGPHERHDDLEKYQVGNRAIAQARRLL